MLRKSTLRIGLLITFTGLVGCGSNAQLHPQQTHLNQTQLNQPQFNQQQTHYKNPYQNTDPRQVQNIDNVSVIGLIKGEQTPPSTHVVTSQLKEKGNDWLFGHGVGKTILNIGTAIAFPPYSIFLLGNAGLQVAGFERMDLIKALPQKVSNPVGIAYDEVTSVPGRIASVIAREQFRDRPNKDTLYDNGNISLDQRKVLKEEDIAF